MPDKLSLQTRVLIVAPTGSDALNTAEILRRAGFTSEICPSVAAAAAQFDHGCGALLITEEALTTLERERLSNALLHQAPWSDLPIILITSGGKNQATVGARHFAGLHGNVILIERPLQVVTLTATVDVALRARRRQFELRDLLQEREDLLGSLEKRIEERTAKLQAMVTEMESFSYSVSHDLRSPLRVLAGYAQVLREDYAAKLPPQARHYLEKIQTAAQRMDRLTQDLLAYTRVAANELVLEPVNLDFVLEDVLETYPALHEARPRIRVRRPLGCVLGHAPSLTQCFSNLLENAVKFSSEKGAMIEVFSEVQGDYVRCYVMDRGPGIDVAHQERIFGLFERATDRRTPGTGIGLAIVKKAVERMKGSVGVLSAPGEGSRFWIDLRTTAPHEKCA